MGSVGEEGKCIGGEEAVSDVPSLYVQPGDTIQVKTENGYIYLRISGSTNSLMVLGKHADSLGCNITIGVVKETTVWGGVLEP